MQFNSFSFMIFFPVAVGVYFIIPRKLRLIWLLFSSYFFYMSWNPWYAILIAASTMTSYTGGILMEKKGDHIGRRKWILGLTVIINLFLLFLFKYGDFMLASVSGLSELLHLGAIGFRFDLLLPIGISFYTFQVIGYLVDVYRRDVEAEKNILRYALFVSFFPQLVAGPIERSRNLLVQIRDIENIRLWDLKRVVSGAILMVYGFFLKMVIADRVAVIVNTVYDQYRLYGALELILATVCFAFQIYCDFFSYSMIALGAAKIMGFRLMENFNVPFFADSTKDLWRRWHISLGSWFRDYVYIPLGGSRKGLLRKEINLMITFLLSGLWHGANWTYVVWGGLQGFYQTVSDLTKKKRLLFVKKTGIRTTVFSWKLLKVICTFALFCFSLIFFRSDTVEDALRLIQRLFIRFDPWILFNGGLYELGLDQREIHILIASLLVLFLADMIRYKKGMMLDAFLLTQNFWFGCIVIVLLLIATFVFGVYGPEFDARQFIYFQF